MLTSFFVAVDRGWMSSPNNVARLANHRSPLGVPLGVLEDRCHLFIKFRSADGKIRTDTEVCRLQNSGIESFVTSSALANELASRGSEGCDLFYFEGSPSIARCVYYPEGNQLIDRLNTQDPSLRLQAHDLPPVQASLVASPHLVRALLGLCADADAELFAPQANHFLNGPHILEQLVTHLMELKVEEAPNFLTVTKGIADQLRGLLDLDESSVKILKVVRSHNQAWEKVYGSTITFIDGGAARLTSLPGVEPAAMRLGSYSVIPGETSSDKREKFQLDTWLIADMTDVSRPSDRDPDRKRLQEASRYILELLVSLSQAESEPRPEVVYLHGALVNQFVAYDDEEPNFLPGLDTTFLARFGVDQSSVTSRVASIPGTGGSTRWSQFMAVYGCLLRRLEEIDVPVVGVVERSTGSPVVTSILGRLRHNHVVTDAYVKKVGDLLVQYHITDSFLFGCLLAEGEYVTPVPIMKNNERRAHDAWKPVVRQYLAPFATLLKPSEAMPPFRLELNTAGNQREDSVARLTYHTARLLPRYAFPVGLA